MKVFLAHNLSNLPMYGDVPDLTQEKETVVSFEITETKYVTSKRNSKVL